jgi:hypothetical protein
MSLLRTNPVLAALCKRFRNRRISTGFIVEAAAGASGFPPQGLLFAVWFSVSFR